MYEVFKDTYTIFEKINIPMVFHDIILFLLQYSKSKFEELVIIIFFLKNQFYLLIELKHLN